MRELTKNQADLNKKDIQQNSFLNRNLIPLNYKLF